MADINTIRDLMRAQPFHPFDLVMVDGTRYTVQHPDYLAIGPAKRPRDVTYYSPLEEGGEEFHKCFLDVNLIAEVSTPTQDEINRAHMARLRPPGPKPGPQPPASSPPPAPPSSP